MSHDIKEKEDLLLKELDENLLLKRKISRLKVIIGLIVVIAFMGMFSSYSRSREFLVGDFQRYAQEIYHCKFNIDDLKTHEKIKIDGRSSYNIKLGETFQTLNKSSELVKRNFNFFEKNAFKDFHANYYFDLSLSTLILTLNNRWENGHWSERDEEVYNRIKSEINSLSEKAMEYGNKLNSKYYILNTRNLEESYEKLNTLAKVYTKYNKLPEEVSLLTEEQLKEKIAYVLGKDYKKIEFEKDLNITYGLIMYYKGSNMYYGKIDALTGKITEIQGGSIKDKGELIDVDKAKIKIEEITKRNLGEGFEVDIKYLGINVNYHSNTDVKVYCFEVQPLFKGYKVFYKLNARVDARSGELEDYRVIGFRSLTPIAKSENLNINIKYSQEEALKNYTKDNNGEFKYTDTRFIKSMFSGDYVLVHYYKEKEKSNGNPQELYINVISGKEEWPVYLEGMITY